jgi:hypothetical protein
MVFDSGGEVAALMGASLYLKLATYCLAYWYEKPHD